MTPDYAASVMVPHLVRSYVEGSQVSPPASPLMRERTGGCGRYKSRPPRRLIILELAAAFVLSSPVVTTPHTG